MTIHRAGTRYHTQDTDEYCGAAVAMMLFEHLGIGGISQCALFTRGMRRTKLEDALVDPDALEWLLNWYLELKGSELRYQCVYAKSSEEAIQRIVGSLARKKPRPAFTLMMTHWILVDGVEVLPRRRAGSIFVHSPMSDRRDSITRDPTPPHSALDVCGSSFEHGLSETAGSAKSWRSLLVPVPALDGTVPVLVAAGSEAGRDFELVDDDDLDAPLPRWVRRRLGKGLAVGVAQPVEHEGWPWGKYELAPLTKKKAQVGWVISAGGKRRSIGLFSRPQPLAALSEATAIAKARAQLGASDAPVVSSKLMWRFTHASPTPFTPWRQLTFAAANASLDVRLDGSAVRSAEIGAALVPDSAPARSR